MNDYRCDHDPAAVCWLCSDQVPWWAEARAKKGIEKKEPLPRVVIDWDEPEPVERVTFTPARPQPTMSADELEGWAKAIREAPRRAPKPALQPAPVAASADVYAYWDAHPHLTYAQAERALKRERKTA